MNDPKQPLPKKLHIVGTNLMIDLYINSKLNWNYMENDKSSKIIYKYSKNSTIFLI